ncbi:hypothetical protein MJ588_02200 [Klebsiella pneumoniae]|nr:hypothetical protein MJ588_02200 [Klebsiella pneumoniae]
MDGALLAALRLHPRWAARIYLLHAKRRVHQAVPRLPSDLHRNHPDLDVQMVPVSVMFGCTPGREKGEVNPPLRMLNGIQKFFAVSWLGRDSFVRFSPSVSLRRMADEHGTDKIIAQKLARVARMYFAPPAGWPPLVCVCRPARICLINRWPRKRLPARWKTKRAARKFRTRSCTAECYRADGRDCGELLMPR